VIGQVFLSYSRKDEESMSLIAKYLRAQGVKVWVDNEKLIPGTPIWEDEIEKAIRNAVAIVVVLSPDSKNSEWVKREMTMADQYQKRVFPVLINGDEKNSISLRLINRQFVDLRKNWEEGMKSLSNALSFYISGLNVQEKDSPIVGETPKVQVVNKQPVSRAKPGRKEKQVASKPIKNETIKASPRKSVFGWLKGGAKGLVAQLADETKRDRAAQGLIQLDSDALPALLEALQTKDLDLLPIYQHILARIPSASPMLTNVLAIAHPIMRARVADVLGVRRDKSTLLALLDALKGEYYTVRARAAIALGRIGDTKAIDPLLNALKDPEDDVRIAACLGLGFFKDPSTFDDITNILLDDPKIEVRQAAAKALGNTKHPDALPYLMEALRDSYWWYEREAAAGDLLNAIANMGEMAVEPLIEALKDKEGAVRKFAAGLLGRTKDPRAIEPLGMALYDLHHDVGEMSAEALVNFGTSSFEILVEALDHPEMWIRIHTVDVLPRVSEPRVGLVLLEMLKDPEREVKKHVIEAMGELKDPRTLPALQEIASDRSDRELHALAKDVIENIK
jgi:HEAT repeat protein